MRISGLRSFMSNDDNRPRVIVAIDTDEGITGWGECYNHGPDRALPPILDYFFEQIKGEDPRRIEFLMLKLQQQARFPGGAMHLAAFSAIDHCLWDISAKAVNLPVYRLLGGEVRNKVRVYLGVHGEGDAAETLDSVLGHNERYGLTAFKLHPYRVDLHAERWGEVVRTSAEYFRQLRELAPSHFEFAFDAHAKIYDPWQAIQLGNALAPYDPMFFEEPIRPEHIPAWAEIKAKLQCPLATGESLYSRYEFLDLFSARGCDIAQPDICVVGGMLEMRKIAVIAEAHYVQIAPHNPMGPLATAVNLHFSAATPNFKILEYRLPLNAPYVKDPYLPEGGYLKLRPERPGWGVEIDEAVLATDRYIHWERKLPVKPDGSFGYP
ncbi:MAG TPA: mandelate racemase/muconate lactonizing enzyme family protein [Devosiaceae bacterium]|nr:mandelate racemase/muconate lactonizing enzyme family protein [Devosiaceae bacterium]